MNTRYLKNIVWLAAKTLLGRNSYEKLRARYNLGYWPNLKNPRTFCEQLINIKLVPKAYFAQLADKYEVRAFVEKRIGDNYLPKLYMVCDRVEDIPWDKLPNSFVLKAVHSGGAQGVIIVRDLTSEDRSKLIARVRHAFKMRFGLFTNEDHYLAIKPRLIAEELLLDEAGCTPIDYKLQCFDGACKVIECHTNRFGEYRKSFYSLDWKRLDYATSHSLADDIPRPTSLHELIEVAEKLAAGFKYVRVDLYHLPDRIVFGEMTFTGASAWLRFTRREVDHEWGTWLFNARESTYNG